MRVFVVRHWGYMPISFGHAMSQGRCEPGAGNEANRKGDIVLSGVQNFDDCAGDARTRAFTPPDRERLQRLLDTWEPPFDRGEQHSRPVFCIRILQQWVIASHV